MALLDFLKRKKEIEKSTGKKEKKLEQKTSEVRVVPKITRKSGSFSYSIIKEPHISEKATDMSANNNQYVFNVQQGSGKIEIKKAVEGVYGVNVLSVNIIKIPSKKRRIGRTQGFKKGYTKAIVKIKQGQTIEIL